MKKEIKSEQKKEDTKTKTKIIIIKALYGFGLESLILLNCMCTVYSETYGCLLFLFGFVVSHTQYICNIFVRFLGNGMEIRKISASCYVPQLNCIFI